MATRDLSAFGVSVAFHLMGFAILWSTSVPVPQRALSKDTHRVTAAFIVAEPEDTRFAGLKTIIAGDDWAFDISTRSSSVSLGQFSFDVSKIADRARVLFPFLTPGLSFEHFQLAPRRSLDQRVRNPFATNDRKNSIRTINRPLVLSDKAVQSVIDAAWSRRDRWNKFQRIIKLG